MLCLNSFSQKKQSFPTAKSYNSCNSQDPYHQNVAEAMCAIGIITSSVIFEQVRVLYTVFIGCIHIFPVVLKKMPEIYINDSQFIPLKWTSILPGRSSISTSEKHPTAWHQATSIRWSQRLYSPHKQIGSLENLTITKCGFLMMVIYLMMVNILMVNIFIYNDGQYIL